MAELVRAFDLAMSAASEELSSVLQESAREGDWGEELSRDIRIGYAGNVLDVQFSEENKPLVFDREFGTEDTPPTAVLRRFFRHPKAGKIVDSQLEESLNSLLEEAVEEILGGD